MKILRLFLILLFLPLLSFQSFGQSTINITTSGGSFATEKWVSITTGVDGTGTQVWGQGDGTYGNASGLINQDISIAPGTYYVNCYDRYSDGWDGTLIAVTAYGSTLGDNGGVSPTNGSDDDAASTWETPAVELEASFVIVVPAAPSCLAPSGLAATNVTATSADLGWTAGGTESIWNIEYGPTGYTQGTGTMVGVIANPYTLSGLMSNTTYDVYVQANCGAGNLSTWTGPTTFATECQILTAPYSYGFESAGSLDNCWTQDVADNQDWTINSNGTSSGNTGPSTGNGGSQYYAYYETSSPVATGDQAILWSPTIDISGLTVPSVSFAYHMFGGTMGSLDAEVSYDGGATWSNIFSQSGDLGDVWNTANIPLCSPASTTIIVRFIGTRGTGFTSDMAIDDFSVQEGSIDNVGVTAVSVTGSPCGDNQVVNLTIQNFGGNTITSIPVAYSINTGTPVLETWTGSLACGASTTYSFTTTFDATTPGTYNVDASTALVGDTDNSNDFNGTVFIPNLLSSMIMVDSTVTCNGFADAGLTAMISGGTGPYTYSWSNGATTPSITGIMAGTYTVTATDANSCTITSMMTLTEPDAIMTSHSVTDIACNGDATGSITLNSTTGGTLVDFCGDGSAQSCTGPSTTAIMGTGTIQNGTSTYPAVYGNWYWGAKHQIIYRVSELNALGISGPTLISSLAFDVVSVNGTATYDNFNIKMGCTSSTDASAWETGLTDVVLPYQHTVTVGWNTHTFDVPYYWDGVSNIVVEVCFNNSSFTNNSVVNHTDAGYTSVRYYRADNNTVCSNTNITGTSNNRPNTEFGYCATASTAVYSYAWSDGSTTASLTGLTAGTYDVTVTDSYGCMGTASYTVGEPLAPLAANATTFSDVSCIYE